MNTTVHDAQIAKYREDGFVKLEGLLNPSEVQELRSAVVDTVAGMGKKMVAGGTNDEAEDRQDYYGQVFTQKVNVWRINPTIKRYLTDPGLGKALCQLIGTPEIRLYHDHALIKEPYGNPTAFHLDNPHWAFWSRDSISIWIALEDATVENGCMWFHPGSHKFTRWENVKIGPEIGALNKVYPELAKIDPVPMPLKAGDCSFHNGLLSHGAGANMTRRRRIAMVCIYMPKGSTFNGQSSVLPRDYWQSLKKGDVLANDDFNPVVGRL